MIVLDPDLHGNIVASTVMLPTDIATGIAPYDNYLADRVTRKALAAIVLMLEVLVTSLGNVCIAQPKEIDQARQGSIAAARLQESVRYVLGLSEEAMLAIVPEKSGIFFTTCPNCNAGSQDRAPWEWDPGKPKQITCGGCGERYPENPRYPDDNYISVESLHGEHRYYYYERPDGYRIFFRAHADYLAKEFMAKACKDLALLYSATREDFYARSAALILLRFAEVYPGYAYKHDWQFHQKLFSSCKRNTIPGSNPYRASRWSWWAYMDISRELLTAYELLYSWHGLDELADGNARQLIETNLLSAQVNYVISLNETYHNMSPGMWLDFINAGRVLKRPDWILEALKRLDTFANTHFLYDGYWMETSPSYCKQVLGSLIRVQDALDRCGLLEDATEETLTVIRDGIKKNSSAVSRINDAYHATKLPNGSDPPINDTWAKPGQKTRQKDRSVLMPGLGLALLESGSGEDRDQVVAWLNFTSGKWHKHRDALSIGLFANGAELLSDVGYTHTKWRAWTLSTVSHNTVVVDGVDSDFDADYTGNRLKAFVKSDKGFQLAEAESQSAYPRIADRYRRACALIGSDSRDTYMIDVFQVKGGQQHDFFLHGPPSQESTLTLIGSEPSQFSGTLMNPGVVFKEPQGETTDVGRGGGYGFLREVRVVSAKSPVTLDLRLVSQPHLGLRTHIVCPLSSTVFVGKAPRIRQAEHNDSLLNRFWAPFFCARAACKGLESCFVAVHEPISGEARIEGIAVDQLRSGLLLKVNRGEFGNDYFIMSLEQNVSIKANTPDGQLHFNGMYGWARMQGNRCSAAALVGGRLLQIGDMVLEGSGMHAGRITSVHRGASNNSYGYFEIGESLDSRDCRSALVVEFSDKSVRAYNIERIEKIDKGTRIHVMEDPGYEVDGQAAKWCAYPQHDIRSSDAYYRLPTVTWYQAK